MTPPPDEVFYLPRSPSRLPYFLYLDEEMAASAFKIEKAPEMAATVTYKKGRLRIISMAAPVLLVLFLHR